MLRVFFTSSHYDFGDVLELQGSQFPHRADCMSTAWRKSDPAKAMPEQPMNNLKLRL